MLAGRLRVIPRGLRRLAPGRSGRVLLAALLCAVVLLIGASVVWQARLTALEQARSTASNLAALLHEQTSTAFKTTDLALQAVRARLESEDPPENDAGFRAFLRMMNDRLGYVRALYVIGPDGFITHDTDYPKTPHVSLADRSYFQILSKEPGDRIFIGNPLISRSVGQWFVPVARRIQDADGRFAGVVAAAVEPQFFEHIYSQLQLGRHDSIALFDADSTMIARVPPRPNLYGRRLDELQLFTARLPESSRGVYSVRNVFSGRMSIIGYAKLQEFPLIVTAVVDRKDALSGWRRLAMVVGLGCLSIIVLGLLLYVTLAKRRLEREVAEQKALLSEKLESVGYMTSSVAHDFRNLLAAIAAGVRLLRRNGPEEKLLSGIDEALEHGKQLTGDLLQFAKDQNFDSQVFDPNARIESLTTLLRQSAGQDVALHLDLAREIEPVEASPAFFDASIINLAVNSSHAMPDGGELRISTGTIAVGRDPSLPAGDYVGVRVADTGQGISPDRLERIFEPFVTSKGRDGTGLGLFQVRRFATGAGGDVRIASEVGKGTTVEILLPAAQPAAWASSGSGRA